jgi:DNA topoisomerase IB
VSEQSFDTPAERLANTRAICRHSYVHPVAFAAAEGHLIDRYWTRSGNGKWLNREGSALRKLLDEEG